MFRGRLLTPGELVTTWRFPVRGYGNRAQYVRLALADELTERYARVMAESGVGKAAVGVVGSPADLDDWSSTD